MADKRIEELNNLYNDLQSTRKNYETNWQDTAKYFRPIKTDITSEKTQGDKIYLLLMTQQWLLH